MNYHVFQYFEMRMQRRTLFICLRSSVRAVLFFAALPLLVCASFAGQAYATGSLSGIVTEVGTGTPLVNITVSVSGPTGGSATTAGDGTYSITGLAPGSYQVQASGSGYARKYYTSGGGTYDYWSQQQATVADLADTPGINFSLELGGTISGTVREVGTNNPLANISIQAAGTASSGVTITAGDGTYSITGLAPGSYTVQASGSGYARKYYTSGGGTYDQALQQSVTASAGGTVPNIDFSLELGGTISGRITSDGSTGIQSITISVSGLDTAFSGSAWTDASGNYSINSLPPDEYTIQAQGNSTYATKYFPGTFSKCSAGLVAVATGGTYPGRDMILDIGGSITGSIKDGTGTGVSGVQVNAMVYDPFFMMPLELCAISDNKTVTTDAGGNYTISGLVPGAYAVQVSGTDPGTGKSWMEFYKDVFSADLATRVAVSVNTVRGAVDFFIEPDEVAGTLSGTIRDEVGNPLGAMLMACTGVSAASPVTCLGMAMTQPDGSYQFALPPGEYFVRIAMMSGVSGIRYYDGLSGTTDPAGATTVAVASGAATTGISFTVDTSASGSITGTVTDTATGSPLPNVHIIATPGGGSVSGGSATTDASGQYTIVGLVPGSYTVRAFTQLSYGAEYYLNKPDKNTADLVAVTNGATTPNINFALDAPITISGKVTTDGSTGIPGVPVFACLEAYGSGIPFIMSMEPNCGYAVTHLDGTYAIRKSMMSVPLGAGTYNVYAASTDYYAGMYYNNKTTLSSADTVTVNPGQTASNVDFITQHGGSIFGTVTGGGSGVEGLLVRACPADNPWCKNAVTDAFGAYTIPNLTPGSYTVSVTGNGVYLAEYYLDVYDAGQAAPVGVTEGNATEVNISLSGPPASSATLTPNPAGQQMIGLPVTFTAGCETTAPACEYKFRRWTGAAWVVEQDYSTVNTWNWDTTGFAPGTYVLQVHVRNAGSKAAYEAVQLLSYTLTSDPATGATLAASPAASQTAGLPVLLTAGGAGGTGSYEYKFRRWTGAAWVVEQDYSTVNTWNWDTTGFAPGTYVLQVHVRNAGSKAAYEAVKLLNFDLQAAPVSSATLSETPPCPLSAGTPILLTAGGAGGTGSYEYKFRRWTGAAWVVEQDYSTVNTWNWDTTGFAPGTYVLQVHVRNAGSKAAYEAVKLLSCTLL